MSVMVTVLVNSDPRALESYTHDNQESMQGIVETAKSYGVIAHRFYGTEDGQVMVLDEWPDAESFQRFLAATQDRIEPMMHAVGAAGEPEIRFWRELDTHDAVGWGA